MTGIEIIESVQWYAITNMGTGKQDPHVVILRKNDLNGTGQSLTSLDEAIQDAYDDLMNQNGEE